MSLHYRIRNNVQVRADGTDGRRFWIRALTYNVVDDYRTAFAPGIFDDSLSEDMPVYVYGHDYTTLGNLLGRYVDTRSTDSGLDLLLELDDPDAVPGARQASAQLRSGTLRRFSVGFELLDSEKWARDPKVEYLTRGRLIEVSSVIDPAVPGTKVLAQVRSTRRLQDAMHRAQIDPAKLTLARLQEIAQVVDKLGLSRDEARVVLGNELSAQQQEQASAEGDTAQQQAQEQAQEQPADATLQRPPAVVDTPTQTPAEQPAAEQTPPAVPDSSAVPAADGQAQPAATPPATTAPEPAPAPAPAPAPPELPADVAALVDTATALAGPRSRHL